MFLTTRGLVLREVEYKEADKILTVLTESEGKITVKARGARRTRSKLAAATQLLAFSDMTLFGNKGFWTVNEAVVVELFNGLRGDIALLALGSYIAEVLEAVSDEDFPNPEVLQLGLNSLYALSSGLGRPDQVKAAFELRLMCLSGYEPDLSACAGCGREDLEEAYMLPPQGALFCGGCKKPGGIPVSRAVLSAMRHIVDAEAKRIFSFSLDDESLARLAEICEAYTLFQLDRHFDSLDYYKKVKAE